jgi:hypothetical protein
MTIYIFQSHSNPRQFAYTSAASAAVLPPDLAPWSSLCGPTISLANAEVAMRRDTTITRRIAIRGYHLFT